MRRHFASGFPRALLSLSQEKSSGVETGMLCDGKIAKLSREISPVFFGEISSSFAER